MNTTLTSAPALQRHRDALAAQAGVAVHTLDWVLFGDFAGQHQELRDTHTHLRDVLAAIHTRAADLAGVLTDTHSLGPVDAHHVIDLASLRVAVAELLDDALHAGACRHVAYALNIEPEQVDDGRHADLLAYAQRALRGHVHELWATGERPHSHDADTHALLALYGLHADVAAAARAVRIETEAAA